MLRPQRLVGEIEHLIVRRVLDGVDLFEDDVALELQVARAQHRIPHQVGEDVQRLRQVAVQDARLECRGVTRGVGVERPAPRLERQRDLLRGTALGALEHHVLEQVGNAHLAAGLVGARAAHPDPHRHRADARSLSRTRAWNAVVSREV